MNRFESLENCSFSDSHDHANKNMKQNSNSCEVISKLLLPQDLMFHIFTLVPPHYLFNSARYVCKPWDAAIASSRFAELCERFHVRSKPGLYIENRNSHTSSYFLEFKDDVNGQFERTDLGTPQKMGYLIGTCDGILLISSMARHIVVVNPILKCWLKIPRFPISQHHIVVGCQCTITRVPRTAKFKLFFAHVLEVSGVSWYVFYVLRIGIDNSWKEIDRKEAPLHWCFSGKPLYSGGNDLYWITNNEVIVMDVDREIVVREYPLPPRMMLGSSPFEILLWMGGRLSCIAYNYSYSKYQIYILDFDSRKWSLYHEMGPFDYMAACGHNLNTAAVFRLWINNQIIFRVQLLPQNQNQIGNGLIYMHFSYNVETKQLTKIEDIEVGDFAVWLHTNSLASLPTTLA
ncbi:uncharacterized protein LOC131618271 [Vicia villosa]|uniref:uncharacterized protein LOC131618271 n=1 Tax=Vicia villosa TaxID=3911 RepID=UPI00273A96AA|nr:uncharacterized protein LOC131618271 [Vicia villosa]